jgi:hypothetical protein
LSSGIAIIKFAKLPKEVKSMATATEVIANETETMQATEALDEMELDRELQLSLEEEDTVSLDEWEKRVKEKAENGYYRQ